LLVAPEVKDNRRREELMKEEEEEKEEEGKRFLSAPREGMAPREVEEEGREESRVAVSPIPPPFPPLKPRPMTAAEVTLLLPLRRKAG